MKSEGESWEENVCGVLQNQVGEANLVFFSCFVCMMNETWKACMCSIWEANFAFYFSVEARSCLHSLYQCMSSYKDFECYCLVFCFARLKVVLHILWEIVLHIPCGMLLFHYHYLAHDSLGCFESTLVGATKCLVETLMCIGSFTMGGWSMRFGLG